MIRFGEIAVTAQRLIDGLVAVELPAVIVGDGVYHGFEVRQQIVMAKVRLVRAAVLRTIGLARYSLQHRSASVTMAP